MKITIGVFGASITYGFDDEEGGWADRLKKYFFVNNKKIRIHNRGISGDSTKDLLKRFEKEINILKPEIVVFDIGTNDSKYFNGNNQDVETPIEEFESNLKELIKISKDRKIVFIGLTSIDESKTIPIPWNKKESFSEENVKKYNEKLKEVCSEQNVKFIDVFSLLSKKDLSDGLHPNTRGHEKLFTKIKSEVLNLI